MTDWNEHEDAICDAISDSIDMDWTSRIGAKAVIAWLNENASAPSSLAGGELSMGWRAFEAMRNANRPRDHREWSDLTDDQRNAWNDDATERPHLYGLAALSPEAPERSGEYGQWEAHTGDDYAVVMLPNENTDTASIQVYSDDEALPQRIADALNAITPRHEAPAEGAGETERLAAVIADFCPKHTAPSPHDWMRNAASEYLRARSSAPEAREGEAPVRGEIRTINGKRCRFIEREIEGEKWEVIGPAHPAAPSADKLREVLIDLTSWFTKPVQGRNGMVWVIPAGEMGADDALNAALAALQGRGAK